MNLIRQAGPGDFDLDGDTDDDDLTTWGMEFGSSRRGTDFPSWQRNYTSGTSSPVLSAATVPEPPSVQMIVTIVAAIVGRRPGRGAWPKFSMSNSEG